MDTTSASTPNSSLTFRLRPVISAFVAGILAACSFYHAVHGDVTAAIITAVLTLGALIRACSQAEVASTPAANVLPESRNARPGAATRMP